MIKIVSGSAAVTKKIGARIVEQIIKKEVLKKGPIFILLEGNLGAGKTTFTMGFLNYFGIKPSAASPTFVIAKRYEVRRKVKGERGKLSPPTTNPKSQTTISDIWHIDAYRLKSKKDLELIGFNTIKKQPRTVVLMEWPVNVRGLRLKNVIKIEFGYGEKEKERIINIH